MKVKTKAKPVTKPTKNKGGQPTKYKNGYCKMLIDAGTKGLTYSAFAKKIKVNIDTLYQWEKVHVEYSEAKKGYEAAFSGWYEQTVRELSTKPGRDHDSTLLIWLGKNKCGWRDKTDVKVEGSIDTTSKGERLALETLLRRHPELEDELLEITGVL